MKTTSSQKKLIKIITMPIRVLNKGKDMYVRSMMDVAQKPRYGSSNMMRTVNKGQAVSDRVLSKSLSASVDTSRSPSYENEGLRDFVRAYSSSKMGLDIDFYLEQLIKEEQMKKLKELMERNNFSKSKSLRRGVSKSYSTAMGRIDEEEEVEELGTSNSVKKDKRLCLRNTHSAVKLLPGFEGPLPFKLQTGYVGVDESEDVQLFYYFVESERNLEKDPLLLWMTGDPGCSSFSALASEVGPIYFELVMYDGTLPTLVLNPNTWTKDIHCFCL